MIPIEILKKSNYLTLKEIGHLEKIKHLTELINNWFSDNPELLLPVNFIDIEVLVYNDISHNENHLSFRTLNFIKSSNIYEVDDSIHSSFLDILDDVYSIDGNLTKFSSVKHFTTGINVSLASKVFTLNVKDFDTKSFVSEFISEGLEKKIEAAILNYELRDVSLINEDIVKI